MVVMDVTCSCGEHNPAAKFSDIWWIGDIPYLSKECRDQAYQDRIAEHKANGSVYRARPVPDADAEPVDAAAVANLERAAKGA